jgi:hypothetical protein
MTVAAIIAILNEIATLEPIGFSLVASFIHGLQGKTDAEILAADADTLTAVVATAHAEAQPQ